MGRHAQVGRIDRAAPQAPRFLVAGALGAAALLAGVLGGCVDQPQITAVTPIQPQQASKVQPDRGDVDRRQLPPPGPQPKIVLPVPERLALTNGTKVLLVERHTVPAVAMVMVWPCGALEDPSDRPGMAALAADMLDEGAGGKSPLELAEAVARLGARLTTRADFNATYVSMMTLSRQLDPALHLLADVVRRPALAPQEMDRVKNDTLTALKQRYDVAGNVAVDLFEQALYGDQHRRAAPLLGTAEAVKKLDHFDMKWWHRERLRPDDATLIVVGDVAPAALRSKLEAELGSWRAPGKRKEVGEQGQVPAPARRAVAMDLPGKAQVVVLVGEPGVARNHQDFFPLLVMNSILGGQFNSRINMNLREKHGYAYGARSEFVFGRRDGGPFLVQASVKGATARASVSEIMNELSGIRTMDVTVDELRQAKDLLVRSLARRFETNLEVASELATIEVFSLPDNYLATYAERVEAVTAADVRRVAQQHLDPSHMTVVMAGDRKDYDRPVKEGELELGGIEFRSVKRPAEGGPDKPGRTGADKPIGQVPH